MDLPSFFSSFFIEKFLLIQIEGLGPPSGHIWAAASDAVGVSKVHAGLSDGLADSFEKLLHKYISFIHNLACFILACQPIFQLFSFDRWDYFTGRL